MENFWTKIDASAASTASAGSATGEIAICGITEYAQGMMGEVSFVELPEVGKKVKAGEQIGIIESLKAVSPIITPIDGEIIEVNALLEKKPETLTADCWIWKMKV